jgi:hypothetical protein
MYAKRRRSVDQWLTRWQQKKTPLGNKQLCQFPEANPQEKDNAFCADARNACGNAPENRLAARRQLEDPEVSQPLGTNARFVTQYEQKNDRWEQELTGGLKPIAQPQPTGRNAS